ncbi:MAG: spermidine resistance protein [Thelocarpon superellum]|nr:MAG: spermidine resistance protein [Thelocarpon superellum]
MVNFEIPQDYTASPSEGTPHLTINREATIDLDSSNAFEGPEKLLEVWFSASPNALPAPTITGGLKAVATEEWKDMLDLVNCKVLSVVESEQVDAYLLSESSMFIFPHKIILKTCGTTTLLCGLPRMLEIAALSAGFPHSPADLPAGVPAFATPYRVFYSRKNFLFPDKQRGPHRSWRDEVRYLDKMFLGGSAYMVGRMNGEHWYLYLTGPGTELTPPSTPEYDPVPATETKTLHVPADDGESQVGVGQAMWDEVPDETLEVLMTDLDAENAKKFHLDHASAVADGQSFGSSTNGGRAASDGDGFDVFSNTNPDLGALPLTVAGQAAPPELSTEGHALGTMVSEACGLSEVYPASKYPDARVDAYLFSPCGFSANGVVPASDVGNTKRTHYFTVHVTPEPHCSYASFETNVPGRQSGRETAEVVEQVVKIFRPGRFSVTLFEAKFEAPDGAGPEYKQNGFSTAMRSARMDCIKGYRRIDRIVHDLDGYDLVFRYYERDDWRGGAPRLGERAL